MHESYQKARSQRAFTLIELLVVIGIIAVLAAGVGVALRGNNPDGALRAGQGLASSALSAARGQAALTQSTARIVVQADRERPDFLRTIRVIVNTGGSNWKQVGSDIVLPEGVFIVPPGTLTGVTLSNEGGAWNVGRNSTLFETAATGVPGMTDAGALWLVSKEISPLGTLDGGRFVVTAGRKTGPVDYVLFNAAAVRGLVVSRYGIPSFVNEPASFDQITN